jgi:hypothetical protein
MNINKCDISIDNFSTEGNKEKDMVFTKHKTKDLKDHFKSSKITFNLNN